MKGPFPWVGSKRRLAKRIIERMPPHVCYVEPFCGSAAVLFAREERAGCEVLNDLDGDIANLFRVVKHHLVEFCHQFRWAVVHRTIFDWLKATPPEVLTDIQRAARFFYLQHLSFGAKAKGRTFGTSATKPSNLNLVRLEERLSEIHERLASVLIECLPWAECIRRYDRPHTLFFLDPPYWQTEGYVGGALSLDDYRQLAGTIRGLQGAALLTINDHPDMRRIFEGLLCEELAITHQVGGARGLKKTVELLYFRAAVAE
jgi:DNA adenine methylase